MTDLTKVAAGEARQSRGGRDWECAGAFIGALTLGHAQEVQGHAGWSLVPELVSACSARLVFRPRRRSSAAGAALGAFRFAPSRASRVSCTGRQSSFIYLCMRACVPSFIQMHGGSRLFRVCLQKNSFDTKRRRAPRAECPGWGARRPALRSSVPRAPALPLHTVQRARTTQSTLIAISRQSGAEFIYYTTLSGLAIQCNVSCLHTRHKTHAALYDSLQTQLTTYRPTVHRAQPRAAVHSGHRSHERVVADTCGGRASSKPLVFRVHHIWELGSAPPCLWVPLSGREGP